MSSEMLRSQVEQQFGVRPRSRDSDTKKREQVSVVIQYSTVQYSTAGPGQRDYSVTKIFNTLFPSLTTRQNKDVLLTYYPHKVYSFIFELSETNIKALLVTIGN